MKKEIIPIVFAINDGFVPYFFVAFQSLMENASSNYQYNIYVFHIGMNIKSVKAVEGLSTDGFKVECIDVDEYMPAIDFTQTTHVSKETLYRLIVPNVLSQYDKVLWLDADTIILDDVSKLYETDIEGKVIGAVPELMHEFIYKYIIEHNMKIDGFFNSGVMIIDIIKMKEQRILEKCVDFLNAGQYDFPDQDALNTVCNGNVFLLPDCWNYIPDIKIKDEFPEMQVRYAAAMENPSLVHYTGASKPWKYPTRGKGDLFWKYARKTVFYEEIMYRNLRNNSASSRSVSGCFDRYIFPWKNIKPEEKVIIYGGGAVGKTFVEQIRLTGYCYIVAVADKNANAINNINAYVITPKEINEFKYDKILIAIEKEEIAMEIKSELMEQSINENSIIWVSPQKR